MRARAYPATVITLVALGACAPTGTATSSGAPLAAASPWSAAWSDELTPSFFVADFVVHPSLSGEQDRPVEDATPGANLTSARFAYSNAEPGATCDGHESFVIDGENVVIDIDAAATSDGTRGVDLHANIGGFDLCYRAPTGATTVRFVANVALPEEMDVTGSTGNVGYFLAFENDRCFGGVGIDPVTHTRMLMGNGRTECSADVPVGPDGLACLRRQIGFGLEANGAIAGYAEAGSDVIHAVVTIHAEAP